MGQLQSELNRAKLLESEAQEQSANLSQQLEEERLRSQKQTKEINELRLMREKFESVTVMVQGEMETLRQQRDQALEDAKRLQGESHEVFFFFLNLHRLSFWLLGEKGTKRIGPSKQPVDGRFLPRRSNVHDFARSRGFEEKVGKR